MAVVAVTRCESSLVVWSSYVLGSLHHSVPVLCPCCCLPVAVQVPLLFSWRMISEATEVDPALMSAVEQLPPAQHLGCLPSPLSPPFLPLQAAS